MSGSKNQASIPFLEKLRGVGSILLKAAKDFLRENGLSWAAAISYYSLLSIFPLLLAAVSLAAFFVQPEWAISQITDYLGRTLPSGEFRIGEIIKGVFDARGGVSVLSFLLLLWSGSRVFGVLIKALNTAFDDSHPYGFFKRLLVELVMVVTLGLLFVVALMSRLAVQLLIQLNILQNGGGIAYVFFQDIVPPLLLFLVFFLIYRFVPKQKIHIKSAMVGAGFTTLVIFIARYLFLGYLSTIANYNLIYGSLAIVVVLLIWTWLIAAIVLFGGQLTSEIQSGFIEARSGLDDERAVTNG